MVIGPSHDATRPKRGNEGGLMTEPTMNLNLGEIRKARELGRKGHCQYVWHACALCGHQQWTELRRGRPRYTTCSACASHQTTYRQNGKTTEQAHICPPHHWLIDSAGMGRCKYCGEMKDFAKLRTKETTGLARAHSNRTGK